MAHRSRIAANIFSALAEMKQPIDMNDAETASAVFDLIHGVMRQVESMKRPVSVEAGDLTLPVKRRMGSIAEDAGSGWSLMEFLNWQERMFPDLTSRERAPIVSDILGLIHAEETQYKAFYELSGGTRKVTPVLRRRCEQAEAARKGEA